MQCRACHLASASPHVDHAYARRFSDNGMALISRRSIRSRRAPSAYNALGQQVVRRDTSFGAELITISVHDTQGRRLAEYDNDAATGALSLMREYVWLDGWTPFAVIEGGQVYHLVWDTIGRPEAGPDSLDQVFWWVNCAPCRATPRRS